MPDSVEPVPTVAMSAKPLLTVFWGTVAVFVLLIGFIFLQDHIFEDSRRFFMYIFFPGIALLTILGMFLIVMAARAPIKKGLKWTLVLTGVSAVGMPAGAVLHNVVFGVMIALFGENFWGGNGGGDEAFFFIMALIVFPVMLVVCAIVGAVILARAKGDVWA